MSTESDARESTNYGYGTPTLVSTANLTVGSSASNQYYFQGDLKGLAIWNIEKSATEIAQNYGSTYQGTEANLVGYWPMNEGSSSSTIKDRVTNTNYSFYVGAADWQPGESYYAATILQTSDYYPFGMTMEGERNVSGEYRYGFQGQEMDDEIKGKGNSANYKYRMHDTRIGRFFAVDPLAGVYPHNSPYAFSENNVIRYVELEGLEKKDPMDQPCDDPEKQVRSGFRIRINLPKIRLTTVRVITVNVKNQELVPVKVPRNQMENSKR